MEDVEETTEDTDPQASAPPAEEKGSGVPLSRADAQMYARAAKEKWPIPPELLGDATSKLGEVLRATKSPRTVIAAVRALNAMVRTNNDATEAGSGGPPINLVLYSGDGLPTPAEGESQISIPDNGRTLRNEDRS